MEDLVLRLYDQLQDCKPERLPGHEGGRNDIYICRAADGNRYVLRVSALEDRTETDYLAETEFVHALAAQHAPVADVLPSVNGRLVERVDIDGKTAYLSLFEYAKGMLISDNGYRYRENAPLSEYFYNTGRALGAIHRLSKVYRPIHCRADYFDKYCMAYLDGLIPDSFAELKEAIRERLAQFEALPRDSESYGLVHFDFSDGNYHVDMQTGEITAFDFDNCMNAWYMFDLANLWTHGVGWCQFEEDPEKRRAFMTEYFAAIVAGYRSETELDESWLRKLPLFIDMVLVENIVDEFECCQRAGEELDEEDIRDAAESLIRHLPYAGFFEPQEP